MKFIRNKYDTLALTKGPCGREHAMYTNYISDNDHLHTFTYACRFVEAHKLEDIVSPGALPECPLCLLKIIKELNKRSLKAGEKFNETNHNTNL